MNGIWVFPGHDHALGNKSTFSVAFIQKQMVSGIQGARLRLMISFRGVFYHETLTIL